MFFLLYQFQRRSLPSYLFLRVKMFWICSYFCTNFTIVLCTIICFYTQSHKMSSIFYNFVPISASFFCLVICFLETKFPKFVLTCLPIWASFLLQLFVFSPQNVLNLSLFVYLFEPLFFCSYLFFSFKMFWIISDFFYQFHSLSLCSYFLFSLKMF